MYAQISGRLFAQTAVDYSKYFIFLLTNCTVVEMLRLMIVE